MAIDQAHEQNNAMVKGDGGAVGLTENPNAADGCYQAQRWQGWLMSSRQGMVSDTEAKENSKHHE